MKKSFSEQTIIQCKECGKVFYCDSRDVWAFTRDVKGRKTYFCKWSCLRNYDKEHPQRKNARTRLEMGL